MHIAYQMSFHKHFAMIWKKVYKNSKQYDIGLPYEVIWIFQNQHNIFCIKKYCKLLKNHIWKRVSSKFYQTCIMNDFLACKAHLLHKPGAQSLPVTELLIVGWPVSLVGASAEAFVLVNSEERASCTIPQPRS